MTASSPTNGQSSPRWSQAGLYRAPEGVLRSNRQLEVYPVYSLCHEMASLYRGMNMRENFYAFTSTSTLAVKVTSIEFTLGIYLRAWPR